MTDCHGFFITDVISSDAVAIAIAPHIIQMS